MQEASEREDGSNDDQSMEDERDSQVEDGTVSMNSQTAAEILQQRECKGHVVSNQINSQNIPSAAKKNAKVVYQKLYGKILNKAYDQSYQPLNIKNWGLKYSYSIPMYRQLGDPSEEYKQWMEDDRLLNKTLIIYENHSKFMEYTDIMKDPCKYMRFVRCFPRI